MTNEELILWPTLRDLGFVSQAILHGCIADFAHHRFKVAVELDGFHHFTADGKTSDKRRDDLLISHGWIVLHFENRWVRDEFREVVEEIRKHI
jgi:very-short-patch-repair endonuclease